MDTRARRSEIPEATIVVAAYEDGYSANKDILGMLILVVVMIVVLLLRSWSTGG